MIILVGILAIVFVGFEIFVSNKQGNIKITYDAQGIPLPLVSYQFVSSRPEAKLYYPNGKVYSHFGRSQIRTDEGLGVAFTGAIMTTNDSPAKVYQWYHEQLIARAWQENKLLERGKASTQKSVNDYEKGKREVFEVAMDDPKQLSWTLGKNVPTNSTVFEFSYMIR